MPVKPLTVITGVLMASSGAIAVGLVVVAFIYWAVGADAPHVRREIPTLWSNAAIFAAFTVASVAAFYSQLLEKRGRWAATAAHAAAFGGIVLYYWP